MKFFRRRPRPPETRTEGKIRFLCEQDGEPERALKERLVPELVSSGVQRAYLARVEYEPPTGYEVALCLRAPEDRALVARLVEPFGELFGRDVHLDILFLSDAQESELARVCAPFFRAA